MKGISFLILALLFLSCKKEESNNGSGIHSCNSAVAAEPYLVGKWKLLNWTTGHYNTTEGFCDVVGSNTYVASDWGIEAYLEVGQDGIFRTFESDSLVNESFVTRKVMLDFNNYGERYDIGCGNLFFLFANLTPSVDSLNNLEIGDTVIIGNPFLDLNFANEPVWSITAEQQYIKIE